jgi:aminoglycoside phosphotransferase (APT) family kinase protein
LALPTQRDPDETRKRLGEWLATKLPDANDIDVSDIGGPTYTGYSHETLIFEASWTRDGLEETRGLVARVEPTSHSVFFEQDVGIELRVMRALDGTGVLVPRIHWYEEDASWLGARFFVMDRVDGVIPPDNPPYTFGGWLLESTLEQQAQVWWTGFEAMAAVHRLDPDSLGLDFLLRHDGVPGADSEMAHLRTYVDRVCGETRIEALDQGLAWLDDHRPGDPEPIRLCWGDSRIGNQIFHEHRCAALLDWEMATLASPEQDVAWFLYFDRLFSAGLGAARPPGFPSREETMAHYTEITGLTLFHIPFYEVMASLRFAAVMVRLGHLMVGSGLLPEDTDFGTNSFAMQALHALVDEYGTL